MSILDRYIMRVVIQGTLMVLLVLAALFAFVAFVSEIDYIGHRDYGVIDAIVYVVLSLPRSIYELFPTAVLIGSLIGLGTMAGNSELIVMRSAGISILRIAWSVILCGFVLAITVAVVGEVLVPPSEHKAQSIRTRALHQNITIGNRNGLWIREGERYLNVKHIYPDRKLGAVKIYQFDGNRNLSQVISAKSGAFIKGEWILRNIQRTIFSENEITTQFTKTETWPGLFNPDLFNVIQVNPEDMSALDLFSYSQYLETNNLDASSYLLAFWVKIITPLSTIVMLLIAIPFVFGSLRTGSAGQRILIGILVGIGFYIINRTMNYLGQVYSIHPVISAFLPVLIVLAAGIYALRRIK